MVRERRWLELEIHCGCPYCGAKPRERCRTVQARHSGTWRVGQFIQYGPGMPTSFHKARQVLWACLFGSRRHVGRAALTRASQ